MVPALSRVTVSEKWPVSKQNIPVQPARCCKEVRGAERAGGRPLAGSMMRSVSRRDFCGRSQLGLDGQTRLLACLLPPQHSSAPKHPRSPSPQPCLCPWRVKRSGNPLASWKQWTGCQEPGCRDHAIAPNTSAPNAVIPSWG